MVIIFVLEIEKIKKQISTRYRVELIDKIVKIEKIWNIKNK